MKPFVAVRNGICAILITAQIIGIWCAAYLLSINQISIDIACQYVLSAVMRLSVCSGLLILMWRVDEIIRNIESKR